LDPDAARLRRQNYRILLEELADLVPDPFGDLPDGASPFAFPVQVRDKAALMRRLADRGIGCLDFWPRAHPSAPPDRAATAELRRRSTVALPVHQRLDDIDLERIAGAVRPPVRRHECLRIDRIDDVDELRPEWTKLAEQSGNVFATWEWNRTWWDAFGSGRRLMVTALRGEQGGTRGLIPLYLWAERPYRIARFVGNRAGDQLGPICAPGDERLIGQGLESLLRGGACEAVLGEQLPGESAWSKRLHGRVLRREGSPVLRFHGSWEDSTRHWSSNLRQQLRRKERRLADRFDMRVRTITERSELEPALDTLFELHRARWAAGTGFAQREGFHREFARRAFEKGWLRLRFAELDGDPVAVQLNFQFCGVESQYQSGRDPHYANTSIGTLLMADAIRRAYADGLQEFRFLRGSEPFKYRFANADPGLETVLFSQPGPSGLAATGAVLAAQRAPRRLRSAVSAKV
jgi:CelD/BcsL family acetyltransferase involved in cellulose biosynthesis